MNSVSRLSGNGRQQHCFSNPLSSALIEFLNLAKLTSKVHRTNEADAPPYSVGGSCTIVHTWGWQGTELRNAGLDIDHARCRTRFGDELGGTEQWDGSHETYQFRDSGIARRSNSTGSASCKIWYMRSSGIYVIKAWHLTKIHELQVFPLIVNKLGNMLARDCRELQLETFVGNGFSKSSVRSK